MPGDHNRETHPAPPEDQRTTEKTTLFVGSDMITFKESSPAEQSTTDVTRNWNDFAQSDSDQEHDAYPHRTRTDSSVPVKEGTESYQNEAEHKQISSLFDQCDKNLQEIHENITATYKILRYFDALRGYINRIEVQIGESAEQFQERLTEQFRDSLTTLDNLASQIERSVSSENFDDFIGAQQSKLDQTRRQFRYVSASSQYLEPILQKQSRQINLSLNKLFNDIIKVSQQKDSYKISTSDDLMSIIKDLKTEVYSKQHDYLILREIKDISMFLQNTLRENSNTRLKFANQEIYSKRVYSILQSEKHLRGETSKKQELLTPSELQFLRRQLEQQQNFCRGLLKKMDQESERLRSYTSKHEAIPRAYQSNALYLQNGQQLKNVESHTQKHEISTHRMIQDYDYLMDNLDAFKTDQEQLQPQEQPQLQEWKEIFSNTDNSQSIADVTARFEERYDQATKEGDQKILRQLATAKVVLMNKEYCTSALEKLQAAMQANGESLDTILSRYEAKQGFKERVTVASYLKPHEIKRHLRAKRPMFDPGAGATHGPYTHRLQFSAILRQARLDSILEIEPVELYASMGTLRFTTGYNKYGTWDDVVDADVPAVRKGDMPFSVIEMSKEVSAWKMHQILAFSDPNFVGEYLNTALSPGPLKQELQLTSLKQRHFSRKSILDEKAYVQGIRNAIVKHEEQMLERQRQRQQTIGRVKDKLERQHQQTISQLKDELNQLHSVEGLEKRYDTIKRVVLTTTDLDGDFFQARTTIMKENAPQQASE